MHPWFRRGPLPPPGDERAGTRPAVLLALTLAAVSGGAAVAVLVAGLQLVNWFVSIEPGPGGLLVGTVLWLAFWACLSAALIGGLTLGYRAWSRLAPPAARRAVDADIRAQQAAAVRAAEVLIERHGSPRDR